MSIKENILKLRNEIPSNVNILAAAKTRTIAQIKEAIGSGIKLFGENYVQEAEKKYAAIKKSSKIELYFIGHLQKNKINRALKIFDVINIDSYEIASAIDRKANKKIPILIEINISNERQKHGCKPEELINLIKKVSELKNIEVIGIDVPFEESKAEITINSAKTKPKKAANIIFGYLKKNNLI